jgi:Fur family ferric uptake transcriptional regulator
MADQREKESFLSFLRQRRQRVTAERLALLDEVFRQHGHIDAEHLLAAARGRGLKISRATVYRNLEHVHGGQRHDHLVCTVCGRVVEFLSPGIAALQSEICRAHGFVPSAYSLQINGLCQACAAADSGAKAQGGEVGKRAEVGERGGRGEVGKRADVGERGGRGEAGKRAEVGGRGEGGKRAEVVGRGSAPAPAAGSGERRRNHV